MPEPATPLPERVRALREEFDRALIEARDASALQAVRDRFLGRKAGAVTELLKSLAGLTPEGKREAGQLLNQLKTDLETRLDEARDRTAAQDRTAQLERDRIDVTLPGRRPALGRRHPLTLVREQLEDIFVGMGYEVYDGPEVEDDYHCFEALNMPPDHPARDMQDTFYLAGGSGLLLRTHTSSGQIRYMLDNAHPPDVRII